MIGDKLIRLALCALLLIPFAIVDTDSVLAQEEVEAPSCPFPSEMRHVLGGHPFLPTLLVPSTFADTKTTLGMAFAEGTFSSATVAPGTSSELKLGAFDPNFQGQIEVVPGLAFNLGISGNLVVGLNSDSALNYGASTSYAFFLGALYEFLHADSSALSIGLEVARPHTLAVSPLEAAEAGVQSASGIANPTYVSSKVTTRWVPNLRFSQSFGKFIGLQSYFGFRLDNTNTNDGNSELKSMLSIGLGLSTDFKYWFGIPIGLTANYHRDQVTSSEGSNADAVTIGVFETLSNAFNVGVEIGVAKTISGNTTVGSLTARAYYN